MPSKINADGSVTDWSVDVMGRKTQEVLGHTAVAITDINPKDTSPIDASGMTGRKVILVNNTLNVSVTISVIARPTSQSFGNVVGTKSIPASQTGAVTSADIPALLDPWPILTIRATAASAPTSGSVSTVLEGVQA